MKQNKYIKVMFGNKSNADGTGFEYKIDEVNVSNNWNPNAENPKEMGGFNFTIESKMIRWLVRGDTLYDVIIPDDAEVVEITNHPSTPGGVFRTNKIIVTNPRKVIDSMAMEFYEKSDIPEKTYYKAMAGCAIRGHMNTAKKILSDKVNKDNIDLVLEEFNDFYMPTGPEGKNSKEILSLLNEIKNSKEK